MTAVVNAPASSRVEQPPAPGMPPRSLLEVFPPHWRGRARTSAVVVGGVWLALVVARWVFDSALRDFFIEDDFVHFWSQRAIGPAWQATWTALLNPSVTGKPLSSLYFWADYQLAGADPYRYHLVLLAVHVLNATLLWRLLAVLTRSRALPLVAAGIFLVAPTNARTLAWSALVPDVIGLALLLAALLCAVRWLGGGRRLWLVAAYVAAVMSTFSKEAYLGALPILWLSLVALPAVHQEGAGDRPWRTRFWAAAPAALLAVAAVGRILTEDVSGQGGYDTVYTADNAAVNLLRFSDYWLQGWGVNLSLGLVLRPWMPIAVVAFALLLSLSQPGGRVTAYWATWFVVLIAPVLFLSTHFEYYYTYAAQIGFVVPLALLLTAGGRRLLAAERRRSVLALTALVGVGALSSVHALASDAAAEAWVTKRSLRIEPWWRSLVTALPTPEPDARIVILDSVNYFDVGQEFRATNGGPGINFLYQRADIEVEFPGPGPQGMSTTPLDGRATHVFRSGFYNNEGFLHQYDVTADRRLVDASTTDDLLFVAMPQGRGRIAQVKPEQLLTLSVLSGPGQAPYVRLTCVDDRRLVANFKGSPVGGISGALHTAVWQVPKECGSFVKVEQVGVAARDVHLHAPG